MFEPVSSQTIQGVDYHENNHVQEMKQGTCVESMIPFWYAGGDAYDALCKEHFSNVIRSVGKGDFGREEAEENNWQKTVDGHMAQILLFDQLSRNAFRGNDEAFACDEKATTLARKMSKGLITSCRTEEDRIKQKTNGITIPALLEGEVYPPYLQFITLPLMHSESKDDHELALKMVYVSLSVAPNTLVETFQKVKAMELEHKSVIDRFGRYPHRNKNLGRESTPEELEWLADKEKLPAWALSQG